MAITHKRIILRPAAGLAHRIRSIGSDIVLCKLNKRELEIVWFKDHALNAPFPDLFEPFDLRGVTLRKARFWDFPRYDVPLGRRNLKLPMVYQALAFRPSCRVGLWDAKEDTVLREVVSSEAGEREEGVGRRE